MKTLLAAIAFVLSFALSSPALARASVPIENLPNNPVTVSSGKTLTPEQVKLAIQVAAIEKNWTLADKGDNGLLATLVVRNKHTIVVEITYSPTNFSLAYSSSINMNYSNDGGQGIIHPNYNRWTQDLRKAIQVELLKQ